MREKVFGYFQCGSLQNVDFWPSDAICVWVDRERQEKKGSQRNRRRNSNIEAKVTIQHLIIKKHLLYTSALVVWSSLPAFNYDYPSSNPADAYSLFWKYLRLFEKTENEQMRPGIGLFKIFVNYIIDSILVPTTYCTLPVYCCSSIYLDSTLKFVCDIDGKVLFRWIYLIVLKSYQVFKLRRLQYTFCYEIIDLYF